MRLKFVKGAFQFLKPVEGRVTGAVFVGEGSWELRPVNESERRVLALRTMERGLEVLGDRFDAVALVFTDATETEIRKAGAGGGTAPARAGTVWDDFRARQSKDLKINVQTRVLADLLPGHEPSSGLFLAGLAGKQLPAGILAVDPSGLDWLAPYGMLGGEDSAFWVTAESSRGFWYLARRKAEGISAPRPPDVAPEHYAVESRITENTRLAGTTTIRWKPRVPNVRVVPLHLFDKLRIQEASLAVGDSEAWTPIAFIQEKVDEDSDAAVVLPAPVEANSVARIRLRYEGRDVLHDTGDGSFAVGARESWYPNLGVFRDLCTFDLTYRTPKGKQVVSVGARVSSKTEGNEEVSEWKTAEPIRVAGFNYGKFRNLQKDDKDSHLRIEVFSYPGTPDVVQEINLALKSNPVRPSGGNPSSVATENYWGTQAGMHDLTIDAKTFAEGALTDAVNSAHVYAAYFGPLTQKQLTVTQQAQWFFGQSWPSLIFLPYLAALDGTQRRELGLGGSGTTDFVDLVGPHEVAHQWWGHAVGWSSYRDTWLSEGFAEFSASLVMQQTLGPKRTADYWERARKRILDKPPGSIVSNDQAGPITLGTRLESSQTPFAYSTIVYSKGAFVLHMLRMLMWDPKGRPPDGPFIEMMRDYLTAYAGENASTQDFQRTVERHMTPSMDLSHDGRMDWFFRQWVYGMEIPRYVTKVDVQAAGKDEYRFTGTVAQEGVSEAFQGYLPLYMEFENGEVLRFALVRLRGGQSVPIDAKFQLPKKPKRVLANAFHDVLTRD